MQEREFWKSRIFWLSVTTIVAVTVLIALDKLTLEPAAIVAILMAPLLPVASLSRRGNELRPTVTSGPVVSNDAIQTLVSGLPALVSQFVSQMTPPSTSPEASPTDQVGAELPDLSLNVDDEEAPS